jgi:hypothetical protein
MKNIRQIFKGNEELMKLQPVEELIEYTQELEGNVFEVNLEDDKEDIFKSMIQDILTSCNELDENKILVERYPELYKKMDAEILVDNLKNYILEMNRIHKLRL